MKNLFISRKSEKKALKMISVSNHEFVELRHQQPQCKTHFVFTDIDIADLDIPEISSAKYQLKNGNAIGAYKKDSSSSSIASTARKNKGKRIVAIGSVILALLLLGAGEILFVAGMLLSKSFELFFRNSDWVTAEKFFAVRSAFVVHSKAFE